MLIKSILTEVVHCVILANPAAFAKMQCLSPNASLFNLSQENGI